MGAFWGNVVILILGGSLAASSLILAKKPDAKALFEKIAPYQGTIGVVMFLWGIWEVLHILLNLDVLKALFGGPITLKLTAVVWPVTAVILLALGFLLGFGMIQAFAGKKSPEMAAKSEQMMKKLAPHQTWLGIVSIACGVWWLLFVLVFWKV